MAQTVKDLNGVVLPIDKDGIIPAYTVDTRDYEYLEECLSEELRPLIEAYLKTLQILHNWKE